MNMYQSQEIASFPTMEDTLSSEFKSNVNISIPKTGKKPRSKKNQPQPLTDLSDHENGLITESIDHDRVVLNGEEDKPVMIITTSKFNFEPLFQHIRGHPMVSNEMKSIVSQLSYIYSTPTIMYANLDAVLTRLIRYYKLNVSTLALFGFNSNLLGDVENITRLLKSFVLQNRHSIHTYTNYVLSEKNIHESEYRIVLTVENIHLFDVQENFSLKNLIEELPKAHMIFYDIYFSWVLMLVVAMQSHNAAHDTKPEAKKTVIEILKDKLLSLNTDSTNPAVKKLINVVKKNKPSVPKPKKVKEEITPEEQAALVLLKNKPKQSSKHHLTHNSVVSEVKNDFIASDPIDIVKPNDIVMGDSN